MTTLLRITREEAILAGLWMAAGFAYLAYRESASARREAAAAKRTSESAMFSVEQHRGEVEGVEEDE
ncbi:hypothetical protein HSRCO_0290 [Halanaeroarchaeum sp. HSR-CO]|uniref:hypothetical protein n=1 Tax=Halanaeroarchaeum sp. HSR-CO TaxID=2866382 RepID=UPI00217E6FF6|nr:hypothetical protein [Halanaeroarchaeum sp. HSR-CO]UWG46589.1 hypothetical protein HSRCO_0290 [Halanaeroarchaeum sp. HSR-CO]